MVKIGYSLSSEEFGPNDLVKCAKLAQDAGFEFAMISDHFHPWTNSEPNGPFVWSVLGALAHTTDRLQLGTGVTALSFASIRRSWHKPPQPWRR
jgi:coenzyme F420-dependent glucose-6-phosphate dehydrogenase